MCVHSPHAHTEHTDSGQRAKVCVCVCVFVEVSEGAVSACLANQTNECHKASQRQEGSRVQHRGNPPRKESPPVGIEQPTPPTAHI